MIQTKTNQPDAPRVLVVDNEPNIRTILQTHLHNQGFEVVTANDGLQAKTLIEKNDFDVIISDLQMPNVDGLSLLRWVHTHDPAIVFIIITAFATVDTAVAAIKEGAFDYITKPFDLNEMNGVIQKALGTRTLAMQEVHRPVLSTLVGNNPMMQEVLILIKKVANSTAPILITGESGTGKGLVAAAIHETGQRKNEAFIQVNCAAIPAGLLESELFGFEKGAFTGAIARKAGRFELAHKGTLFLDEVGELHPDLQVKLLRAIQEKTFERVGGVDTLSVDTRLIAATNRNLKEAIEQGKFREDLFYRLNVIPIQLPALRQRRDDIPGLIDYFNKSFSAQQNRRPLKFSAEVLGRLTQYGWPGNIRELENTLERLVVLSENPEVGLGDLPAEIRGDSTASASVTAGFFEDDLKEVVKHQGQVLEKELILRALEKNDWNVTRAARLLNISRKTLQNKMRHYRLRDEN